MSTQLFSHTVPDGTSATQYSSLSSGPPRAGQYPNTGKLSFSIYSTDVSTPNVRNTLLRNNSTGRYANTVMQSW